MKHHSTSCSVPSSKQLGLSLVIVMLFLSAISGITIWAVRQSILGEGLSRNQLDSEVAHQAAEAALRDAERDLMNIDTPILPNASCSRGRDRTPQSSDFTPTCIAGLCTYAEGDYANSDWTNATATNTVPSEPWWPKSKRGRWNDSFSDKPGRNPVTSTNCATFTGGVPLGTFTGQAALKGVAIQPEYLVEIFRRYSPVTLQTTNTYRITARGFGYTQRTQVVLQTVYMPLQDK